MIPLPSNLDTRQDAFRKNRDDMVAMLGGIETLLEQVAAGGGERAMQRLRERGINTHLRRSRGLDVDGACGQLRRRAENR